MVGTYRSNHLPYVVRWIGRFDWNKHNVCEISNHRTERTARNAMIRQQERWEQFFGQPFPIGVFQVVDIRTGNVVAECY